MTIKVSALTAASAPDTDDLVHLVEDGASRKATIAQLLSARPMFLAYNSATDADQTGNSATPTVDFDTEVFDTAAAFSADTFTAPITGKYRLSARVHISGITGTPTIFFIRLITSNRSYVFEDALTYATITERGLAIEALCDMDAGDTATVQVQVNGLAGNTIDIYGEASTTHYTYFCGEFVG